MLSGYQHQVVSHQLQATTQCVVTYNFFGIAQNRLVNQQEIRACVRKVSRCPFLHFCFLLQMSIDGSIFFRFFCEAAFVSYIFFEIPSEKLARAGQNFSPRAYPTFDRCVDLE